MFDWLLKPKPYNPDEGGSERWLIVGLGNPGAEYVETRHNVGFMVLDHLARKLGVTFSREGKFEGESVQGKIGNTPVTLLKPLTYMNLSGRSVGKACAYYKIPPERVLVVYDDVALPFGKIRIRGKGSAGGQNGMKSIIEHLGGDGFPRIRVGIGEPKHKKDGRKNMVDHVLSTFTKTQREYLDDVLAASAGASEVTVKQGFQEAMNRFNGEYYGPPEPEQSEVPDVPPMAKKRDAAGDEPGSS